ncbi:MAG TPA: hypothetical protein VG458_09975, partial [Solirubrobacterales bacterium]|nr:hypothetical protein [Solirubrobacterales bacterium]
GQGWESSHSVACKPDEVSWLGRCLPICAEQIVQEGPIRGSRLQRLVLGGAVPPGTARVEVEVSRDGSRRTFHPLEAHVTDSALLRRLRQTEPFTAFGTVLPLCTSARAVRVLALDAAGAITGGVRGQNVFSNPCRLTF